VNRNLACVLVAGLAIASAAAAQSPAKKTKGKKQPAVDPAAQQGKALFDKKCGLCHYATSGAKKIGPGLKGLNKRGTFQADGNKITEDSLRRWIENGNNTMPPFKGVFSAAELDNLIRYLKIL